jgi:hypothetical protein
MSAQNAMRKTQNAKRKPRRGRSPIRLLFMNRGPGREPSPTQQFAFCVLRFAS